MWTHDIWITGSIMVYRYWLGPAYFFPAGQNLAHAGGNSIKRQRALYCIKSDLRWVAWWSGILRVRTFVRAWEKQSNKWRFTKSSESPLIKQRNWTARLRFGGKSILSLEQGRAPKYSQSRSCLQPWNPRLYKSSHFEGMAERRDPIFLELDLSNFR